MGKNNSARTVTAGGNTFVPVSGSSPIQSTGSLGSSKNSGHSAKDTISSGTPLTNTYKKDCCCIAQDRLSQWFANLGCLAKTFFILGSIVTCSLMYLVILLGFACAKESNH